MRRNRKRTLRKLLRATAKLLPTRWRLAMGIRLRKKHRIPLCKLGQEFLKGGLNVVELEKGMEVKHGNP